MTTQQQVASYLLEIKAVKLQPSELFSWASGIKSPIYCDNRKTLSYPEIRNYIAKQFAELIKEKYSQVEIIAGVATGGIAIGVLVANELDLPFIYVRSSSKGHGLQNKIEGVLAEGKKVVVIEDLISTGGSSLKAVEALRNSKAEVLALVAIFTYGFQKAIDKFAENNCQFDTLSNYDILIEQAVEQNYIKKSDLEFLTNWRKSI